MIKKTNTGGYKFFRLKHIVYSLLIFGLIFGLSGSANAYSGGGGTCDCGNGDTTLGGDAADACVDCTAALNDTTNCGTQVNYNGTVVISNYGGTCIDNPANFANKIFDCQENIIDGDSSGADEYGISIASGQTSITIENCIISGFHYGIWVKNSVSTDTYITITDNTISTDNNYGDAIYFWKSNKNSIEDNTITTSGVSSSGIRTYLSNSNDITSNTITTSGASYASAIYLERSKYNNLTDNSLSSANSDTLSVFSDTPCTAGVKQQYNHSIDTSNLVDGKPVYYYYDLSSTTIENLNGIGNLYVTSSNDVTIRDISDSHDGIRLACVSNSVVTDFDITTDAYGTQCVRLQPDCDYNIIENGTCSTTAAKGHGIYLRYDSNNNVIGNNTITTSGSEGEGVYLRQSCINNNITNNNITTNSKGIYLEFNSDYNNITNNTLLNNQNGVYFADTSNYNNLTNNAICSSTGTDIYDLGGNDDTAQDDNNTCDSTTNWDDYETTGCTYVCGVASGATVSSVNSTGCSCEYYTPGETICVNGSGFDSNEDVRIYIVQDKNQWQDGDVLNDVRGAGGYNITTTDGSGEFAVISLWGSVPGDYDIVVDQDGDGYYNDTRDAIDSAIVTGFHIYPEPLTLILVSTGLLALYGFMRVRRKDQF